MSHDSQPRVGQVVRGRVVEHHPYGITVDIGAPQLGVVVITMLEDEPRSQHPRFPPVGTEVECVLLGFTAIGDQPRLSMRPSDVSGARH